MTTGTQPRHVETGRLLGWLADVLKKSEAVNVEIDVADDSDHLVSVQITLRDVPAALVGSEGSALAHQRFGPEHDEKQLEIFPS